MANMTVNQRTQLDRVELSVPTTGVQVRDRRRVIAFTVLASLVAAALVYATIVAIDGWAQAIVLGAILLTAVGAMIAVSPMRRS
jgi:fatty acid desaturase